MSGDVIDGCLLSWHELPEQHWLTPVDEPATPEALKAVPWRIDENVVRKVARKQGLLLERVRRDRYRDIRILAPLAVPGGYGSPSQFSREYRRLFGKPPARDVKPSGVIDRGHAGAMVGAAPLHGWSRTPSKAVDPRAFAPDRAKVRH
jgi:hypothetical protein